MNKSVHAGTLLVFGFEMVEEKSSPDTFLLDQPSERPLLLIKAVPTFTDKPTLPGFWSSSGESGNFTIAIDELGQVWLAHEILDLMDIGFSRLFEEQPIQ